MFSFSTDVNYKKIVTSGSVTTTIPTGTPTTTILGTVPIGSDFRVFATYNGKRWQVSGVTPKHVPSASNNYAWRDGTSLRVSLTQDSGTSLSVTYDWRAYVAE